MLWPDVLVVLKADFDHHSLLERWFMRAFDLNRLDLASLARGALRRAGPTQAQRSPPPPPPDPRDRVAGDVAGRDEPVPDRRVRRRGALAPRLRDFAEDRAQGRAGGSYLTYGT